MNYGELITRRLVLIAVVLPLLPITLSAILALLGSILFGIAMLVTWTAPEGALLNVGATFGLAVLTLSLVFFGVPRLYLWSMAPALRQVSAPARLARGVANRER